MTTDNNFRVKNGVVVGNGSVASDAFMGVSAPGINVVSTTTNDIDLYTNNWSGDGVEVWLRHGEDVQINTANGAYSWQFKNDGTQGFPTLTTPHAGTGQTLRFNDPSQQVVITNSTATATYPNSTRIVIQGSEGYVDSGEGGDIYLWAGNSGAGGGSGGDIKIDAGYGYNGSEGGTIKIRAGDSDSGAGGFLDLYAGTGTGDGGPVRIYSGDGNNQLQIDNTGVKVLTTLTFADSTVQTTAWTGSVSTSSVTGLSTIAYTGNLGDATGNISTSSVTGLSTVGYTNDYNDLSNKPTIPAAFDLSTVTNQALFTTSSVRFTGLSLSTGTQVQKVVSSGGFPLNSAGTASIYLSSGASPALVVSNYSGSLVPNVYIRAYGQNRPGGISTTQANPTYQMEGSRGTNSAPTAITSGDSLGGITIGGFDGNNWMSDTGQGFNFIGYFAAENWTSTGTTTLQAGSSFNQFIQPAWTRPGTNTTRQRMQITSWTTSSTGPSQLNWGIGSGVDGTAPTMTMVDGTTYTGYGRANIGFSNAAMLISGVPLQDTAPDNNTLTGTNILTILGSRKSGGTGRRNPIVVGDALGVVQFNGQSATNTTGVGVTGAYINAVALDNFSGGTTRGTRFNVFTVNSGTSISSGRMFLDDNFNTFASNAHVFQNKNQSFTALALTTATAVFTAIPQFPVYTAAAAGAITGALGQQICISDSGGGGNPDGMMAFWDTTHSRWSYIHDNSAV